MPFYLRLRASLDAFQQSLSLKRQLAVGGQCVAARVLSELDELRLLVAGVADHMDPFRLEFRDEPLVLEPDGAQVDDD